MRFASTPALLFLCAISIGLGFAQGPGQRDETYVERVFRARVGEVPNMGWFSPLYGFVAQDTSESVTIYPPLGMPLYAGRKSSLSDSDLADLRKLHFAACDIEKASDLTLYSVAGEPDDARALYTTKKWPGEVRSGLISIPMNSLRMAAVNRLLKWPGTGVLRRDEAIGTRAGSFFYSLHRLYKPSGLLSQEAVVLHAENGAILAHELFIDQDQGQQCDSCGIPSYTHPVSRDNFRPVNMFEIPGFRYPLLLLDTSTFEGQALSFFTFTPDHKPAEFRVYEYVMHCR